MNRPKNIFVLLCSTLCLTFIRGHAETVFWSDNFETNAVKHWTTSSVWHVGSPTAGPALNAAGFRAHSATNCASTQNYPANQDARLICTNYNGASTLTVPAASQSPRLRFWHWFNFKYDSLGIYALGFVEIKAGTNDWQQISPSYQKNGGGVWTRPSIDLSAFAGQEVQIAFHFYGGCCGNALGWYVDDVAVVTDPPVLNAPESFESGGGDWAVQTGTWEIGKPTSGPNAAHIGTNCAATVLAGNYANDVDSRLISAAFAVPTNGPVLRFWHWYSFNNAVGFVEISTNGTTWTQVSPSYLNGSTGSAWTNVSLSLNAYAGQTVQAAFRFGSGGVNTAVGWYVDDVTVLAAPVLTVPVTQTIFAGQILTVTNFATNNFLPNSTFIFSLASPSSKVVIATNGVLTWTNTAAAPGTNLISVKVTDNSVPPLSTTNSFSIIVIPTSPTLTVSNSLSSSNGFRFSFQTWSNTTWRIDTSTNLLNWQPFLTNTTGASGTLQVTDLQATNFLQRFYRAVYP